MSLRQSITNKLILITQELVVDTAGAYSDGDALSAKVDLANAAEEARGAGKILAVYVSDLAKQGANIDFLFFDDSLDSVPVANTALDLADADLTKYIGFAALKADSLLVDNGVSKIVMTSPIPFVPVGPSLWMVPVAARYQSSYETMLLLQFGIVFVLLVLPTFLMGTAFPLAVKIVSMGRAGVGRPVGLAYGWNTAGSIMGSFVGGFVLIPLLGLQDTIGTANVVNWLAGTLLVGLGTTLVMKRRNWKRWAAAGVPAVAGILVMVVMPGWNVNILNAGPFVYADQYMEEQSERKISIEQLISENKYRSEERRGGKEGRCRWSPYH